MIKFYKTEDLRVQEIEEFEPRCWVELVNPTDDEVEDVCAFSGMPEEMLKAALDEEESARVEVDDGVTMYVVDSPMLDNPCVYPVQRKMYRYRFPAPKPRIFSVSIG